MWRQQVGCANVELKGVFPADLRVRDMWEPIFGV